MTDDTENNELWDKGSEHYKDLKIQPSQFINKNELPFKVAIDPESKILGEFEQVKLTPTTIITDKNKVIKQTIIGEINYEDLKETILKLR